MPQPDNMPWHRLPAEVTRMYRGADAEAAHLRAAHLNAVIRLTPPTMAANLGCACFMAWAFSPNAPAGLWLWLTSMAVFCGLTLLGWWRRRGPPRATASARALHHATVHAAVLSALWGVMAVLWFPQATQGQQLALATLMTGMLGAGSFVLSPLPWASLAYTVVFAAAALWALWRDGSAMLISIGAMMAIYAPMVAFGSLASWRKATALLRAQAQSARQEKLVALLLHDFEQQAGEAFWEIGHDGLLKHQSPRLAELLTPACADCLGQPLLLIVQRFSPDGAPLLRAAFDAGHSFRELALPWGEGTPVRHLVISGKRLLDENGQPLGWRGVLADVTQKVRSERLLRQLAHTDSLTGLANRFVLRDTLAQAVRQGQRVALLSVDLDHFKSVNDSHGHSAGDELLVAVAQRLQACVRPGDLVARLGGDEFALLLLDPGDTPDPTPLACRVIERLSEPIDVGGRRLRVGASVGVALCTDPNLSVDELLVQADMALYAAKAAGRGRHLVFSPELGAQSHRRLAIEGGLRQAIRQGELAMHWQPKVDIQSWRVIGAEALMRWTHHELGRVSPKEFIVVAEQAGLIDELGCWALNEACRAGANELQGLTVSVNVSPMQLRDDGFVAQVRQALRDSGMKAAQLELEITESVFIDDADGALNRLHSLRALGVRVALDDFGTGYSSLSYLRRFPFDTLKIDRSFVSEIMLRPDARAIVQMIANLATTLGMATVCEGVETAEQLQSVASAGCDQVQGFLISEPRPLSQMLQLRQDWPRSPARNLPLH